MESLKRADEIFEGYTTGFGSDGNFNKEIRIHLKDRESALSLSDIIDEGRDALKDAGIEWAVFKCGNCRLASMYIDDLDKDALEFIAHGHLTDSAFERVSGTEHFWNEERQCPNMLNIMNGWREVQLGLIRKTGICHIKELKGDYKSKSKLVDLTLEMVGKSHHIEQYVRTVFVKTKVDEDIEDDLVTTIFEKLTESCEVFRVICNGKVHDLNPKILGFDSKLWDGYNMDIKPLYITHSLKTAIENNKKYDVKRQLGSVELSQFAGDIDTKEYHNNTELLDPNAEIIERVARKLWAFSLNSEVSLSENDEIISEICSFDKYVCTVKNNLKDSNAVFIEGLNTYYEDVDKDKELDILLSVNYLAHMCMMDGKHLIDTKPFGEIPLYLTDKFIYEYGGCKEELVNDFFSNIHERRLLKSMKINDTLTLDSGETINIKEISFAMSNRYLVGYVLVTDNNKVYITDSVSASRYRKGKVMKCLDSVICHENPDMAQEIIDKATTHINPNRQEEIPNEFMEILKDLKEKDCHIHISNNKIHVLGNNREMLCMFDLDSDNDDMITEFYKSIDELEECKEVMDRLYKFIEKVLFAVGMERISSWVRNGLEGINEVPTQQPQQHNTTKTKRLNLK